MPAKRRAYRKQAKDLSELSDAELLELRFCDLHLSTATAPLRSDIEHVYAALDRRGITFKPHVWTSTDWFSPDGIPGIAVPFFAAHPRLAQLERRMNGEAEGANRHTRRRILRHETGHALDTAFGLRRRADWRAVFGRASKPYPTQYAVRPASRRFVQHLGHWYAQSHPTEDFAETFAVWLQPRARWRREYRGWPALRKLEYVDTLMAEIAYARPRNRNRAIVLPLSENRRSLREHYRRQRTLVDSIDKRYDAWLLRVFMTRDARPDGIAAGRFLAAIDGDIKRALTREFGSGSYLFRHVMDTQRKRARHLDLVLRSNQRESKRKAIQLHVRVVTDLLRRNRERFII